MWQECGKIKAQFTDTQGVGKGSARGRQGVGNLLKSVHYGFFAIKYNLRLGFTDTTDTLPTPGRYPKCRYKK